MTGVADKGHYGCGVSTVRDLRLVPVEPPLVLRRGRPQKRTPPPKVWLGFCTACSEPRLFERKPPEQLTLEEVAGPPPMLTRRRPPAPRQAALVVERSTGT